MRTPCPLANVIFLWKNRDKLEQEEFRHMWGTMYDMYVVDRAYFFESIMMAFKLALLMALVFFEHGSQFQLSAVLLVAFVQIAVHAKVMPFTSEFDNNMQFCGTFLTFVSAFGGLMLGYIDVTHEAAKLRTIGDEQAMLMDKYTGQVGARHHS